MLTKISSLHKEDKKYSVMYFLYFRIGKTKNIQAHILLKLLHIEDEKYSGIYFLNLTEW
jgi:hypothetical protein